MPPTRPLFSNPSRAALAAGVFMLAAGLLALAMGWRPVAPYLLLLGFALLVLWAVLRPRSAPDARANESMLFGRDTTEFGSRLDDGGDDGAPPDRRR